MTRLSQYLSVFVVVVLVVALSACGSKAKEAGADADNPPGAASKLKVETSFYPMYEFTSKVAGDLADVHLLVPSGVEPHDWEPTPQDIGTIEQSDLLVYNGAGIEGWVDQVLSGSDNKGLMSVEASKGLDLMQGVEDEDDHEADHEADHGEAHTEEGAHDHDHGGLDPHVWLSPKLAIQEVRNIEAGLSEKAPEHKDQFKQNADAYVAQLEQLDQEYIKELTDTKRKDFITQHAAFGYLAKSYGLTQVPIAGLSPEQEPSAAAMANVVKFAKEHQVKTIFFETLVSSQVADTIAKEVGAVSAVLNPIEGLTAEDQTNHMDYIKVMQANLAALKKALNE